MIKECLYCQKEFKTIPSVTKRGLGKFCSRKCYEIHKRNKVTRECLICRKEFKIPLSEFKKNKGKYCSNK